MLAWLAFLGDIHNPASAWLIYFGTALIWLSHFFRQSIHFTTLILAFIGGAIAIFLLLAAAPEPISVNLLISLLLLYGVSMFVLIGDALMGQLGARLTAIRGEKWTKELDYVYLTLGSIGIAGSVNRVGFLTRHIESADILAPLILTTAVVVRFVKTRAEIEGWNKPSRPAPPPNVNPVVELRRLVERIKSR